MRWTDARLVFKCSWSDWFHPGADQWRDQAWDVVRQTPHLTYQILTKRPELIAERLPSDWDDGWDNVWLGVSIENSRFTWRADALRDVPSAVRFVAAEPLLGSLFDAAGRRTPLDLDGIDWLIVGGESGPRSRPLDLAWAFELAAACDEASTAFFMKQLGTVLARRLRARRGHKRAIGAVKHSIIVAAWHMLTTGEVYRVVGGDYFTQLDPEKQTRRLVAQLERLGHTVTLQDAA